MAKLRQMVALSQNIICGVWSLRLLLAKIFAWSHCGSAELQQESSSPQKRLSYKILTFLATPYNSIHDINEQKEIAS